MLGSIYVPVVADVADSIMTLDSSSGTIGENFYLSWNVSRYSGVQWFGDDKNNYLQEGWRKAVNATGGYINDCSRDMDGKGHTPEFQSFLYHVQNKHCDDLNDILQGWEPDKKMDFILLNGRDLINCIQNV